MPLSGAFFVSLHHQSTRMTMFKKTDPNPQLDIFTAPSMQLGSRASKKYSDPNAWHNQFYSHVTTKIDEEIFKPLFPEGKKSGRPNASIRILVTMSVLKEDSSKTVYRSGTPPSPPRRHGFARHDSWQLARLHRSGNLPQ